MSEKRFQKTRIVDKWGGIYDSKIDEVLNINDITNKLNEFNEQLKTLLELLDEQQTEIERLNKELIKAITKSIPPKKYEDIDKKHKPWKYVNTNCD